MNYTYVLAFETNIPVLPDEIKEFEAFKDRMIDLFIHRLGLPQLTNKNTILVKRYIISDSPLNRREIKYIAQCQEGYHDFGSWDECDLIEIDPDRLIVWRN